MIQVVDKQLIDAYVVDKQVLEIWDGPALAWKKWFNWNSYSLSGHSVVNQTGVAASGYWPDGKLSLLKGDASGDFMMYWAERGNYRTVDDTTWPENHISQVQTVNRVFGQGVDTIPGFTDNGTWFIGVFRSSGNNLIGFFHAESAWGGLEAYKSIGVAYSSDNGLTWTTGEKILAVDYPKPSTPAWGGLGDACVVFNEAFGKFICYYSAMAGGDFRICMAASDDPLGAQGTWLKWDGSDFTITGYDSGTDIGGTDVAADWLSTRSGANPSVMWNSLLKKWVMAYAGWDDAIHMSASTDGLHWEMPIAVTDPGVELARYPNLISGWGDLRGGRSIRMYYGRNQNPVDGKRELAYRTLTYTEASPDPGLPNPITTESEYVFTVGQSGAEVEAANMPIGATIEWWLASPGYFLLGNANPQGVDSSFLTAPMSVQAYVRYTQDGYSTDFVQFLIKVEAA